MENISKMEQLIQKKKEFLEIKYQYTDKLKEINQIINNINTTIYNECGKNGHKFIMEREYGMYGETFYTCEYCGMDR